MPPKSLVLDGLWYCLCPSFNLRSLNSLPAPLAKARRAPRVAHSSAFLSGSSWTSRRCLNNSSPRAGARHSSNTKVNNESIGATEPLPTERKPPQAKESWSRDDADIPPEMESVSARHIQKAPPGAPQTLQNKTTSFLETKLQESSAREPKILSTTQILRILIRDRHIRPEVRHYRALILANTDAERGSPDAIRQLLTEMEGNGIPADSGTLHAALQVLAIHPDYMLRQEIIRALRDRWLPLSPAGWHYVVAGLLREHQFELAIDHIAQMERKDIMVENWLYSLVIYYLCDFGEFDEVIRLMRSRVDQGHDMSLDLWSYVLDKASLSSHHETTRYVWRQMVGLGYLSPSHRVCTNVLALASRTADANLATSVVRFLVESEVTLGLEDYEKLAETHIMAGDLYSGLETLCKAQQAGVTLQPSSTPLILKQLIQSRTSPQVVWDNLKELKAQKYAIPLRCAQLVIELYEHEALSTPAVAETGLEFYKQLYALCPGKADVFVYNSLIGMCRRAQNTEAGMFIVTEMATLGVVPNAATFEHLVLMCLRARNSQSAYFYLEDMLARGFQPTEGISAQIRDLCVGLDDEFAMQLRHHPQIQQGNDQSLADTSENRQSVITEDYETSFGLGHRRVSREEYRAAAKERRKQKRRRLAIARTREEEGWEEYEPGGLIPEDETAPTK